MDSSVFRPHGQKCVDKPVQVPVHDALDVAVFVLCPMILHELIGHKNVGTDLTAPFDFHLHALDVADLFQVFPFLDLGQSGTQHVPAVFQILEMAALDLTRHHDAGRDMGQADRRGGLVDLLSAGARGTEHIHLDVLLAQLDLGIVRDLGHDLDGGKLVWRRPAASKGETRTRR